MSVSETGNKSNADVLDVGESLHGIAAHHMNTCYNFHHIGREKLSVSFRMYHDANTFVNIVWQNKFKVIEEEVWVAYIPPFKIFRQVILRGIDNPRVRPDFVKEHLRASIESVRKWRSPVKVERLRKRVVTRNKEVILVDTHLLIATFDYTDLPSRALYLAKNVYLRPFMQSVRRCTTCQRFGHTKHFCRSEQDSKFCERCAGKGHLGSECTAAAVSCINCIRAKGPDARHRASDPECPSFIRQKAIKRAMAMYCLRPREAEAIVEVRGVESIPDPDGRSLPTLADFLPLHMTADRAPGRPLRPRLQGCAPGFQATLAPRLPIRGWLG